MASSFTGSAHSPFPGYDTILLNTVSVKKLARVQYFVTELCQFFGGDCKVKIAVKQRSQTLLAVWNKGGELILSKKTPQLKGRGPKKGKKRFFEKFENP
jgi:hypothetical protein